MKTEPLQYGAYNVEDYEALTDHGESGLGDREFAAALPRADAATLVRAYRYALDEAADGFQVVRPLQSHLSRRFSFTDDDLQLIAEGFNPASNEARAALGLASLPAFYAVKMRSGMVMCFPWNAEEISQALINKGVLGVIRGLQAPSQVSAEEEAKRLFAAGDYQPSEIAILEAARASSAPASLSPMETKPTTNEITLRPATALPDHPLLAHIPVWQASEPEFQSLKASIIERGVDYPVLIDSSSRVVDGRNRRNACAAAGLEVPTRIIPDDQVAGTIVSALGNRRHVTKGAMAYLLAPLLKPALEEIRARQHANLRAGASERLLSGLSGSATIESMSDGLGFGRNLFFQALEIHRLFAGKPELRLQFEERILTGELGLGGAIQAIAGKLATEGKSRRVDPPAALITRAFTDLRNRWAGWANVPPTERDEVKAQVVAAAPEWPADLAAATAAAWRKAGLIS